MDPWLTSLIGLSLAAWVLLGRQIPSGNGADTNESGVVNSSKICNTEACHQVADAFINSINESVDPCVNFYEYACGDWLANNPVPNNMSEHYWSSVSQFNRLAQFRLRDLLEAEPSAEDILPIKQVKKMYKMCMNESKGVESIIETFRRANGWPMIMSNGSWNRDAMTWQEIDQYYENLSSYSTFWTLEIDQTSYGLGQLRIDPPSLIVGGLPTSGLDGYRSVMKNLTQTFININNASVSNEQLEKDIDDLLKFEVMLVQITKIGYFTLPYKNVSVFMQDWGSNVSSNTPRGKINWVKILERALSIANLSMADESPIHLTNLDYFWHLGRVLESTDERTIVNFIHWRFLLYASTYTSIEMKNIQFPLSMVLANSRLLEPRWLRCIQQTDPATIHLFGRKFYEGTTKDTINKNIHTMVTNIKKSFMIQATKSNWLSIEAREAIKEKFNRMKYQIGYPEWYDNATALSNYYEGLKIGDTYSETTFSFIKTLRTNRIKSWGRSIKYGYWNAPILSFNAFNDRLTNTLILPVVGVQPPLLRGILPEYVEYGTIGRIIAHEIGHSIDTAGIRYGLESSRPLFNYNMAVNLFERAHCFIQTFDKYYSGIGVMELSENIADWYAVQAAFDYYKEMRDEKYPNGELKLPKFQEFTDEKMFFISSAQTSCTASKEQKIDVSHSAISLRVINSLSNTVAFAETFNCSKNSPMNPKKKCDIWMKPSVTP